MEKRGWKITAIIFIILFLISTAANLWVVFIGVRAYHNELECSVTVCGGPEYDAYAFDSVQDICYCYSNYEIIKTEYLGG